jgi:hypothetical protein
LAILPHPWLLSHFQALSLQLHSLAGTACVITIMVHDDSIHGWLPHPDTITLVFCTPHKHHHTSSVICFGILSHRHHSWFPPNLKDLWPLWVCTEHVHITSWLFSIDDWAEEQMLQPQGLPYLIRHWSQVPSIIADAFFCQVWKCQFG